MNGDFSPSFPLPGGAKAFPVSRRFAGVPHAEAAPPACACSVHALQGEEPLKRPQHSLRHLLCSCWNDGCSRRGNARRADVQEKVRHYPDRTVSLPELRRLVDGSHQAAWEQGLPRGGVVAVICFLTCVRTRRNVPKGQVPLFTLLRKEGRTE